MHALTVSTWNGEPQPFRTACAKSSTSPWVIGVWMYVTASTIRQGAKAGTDAKVLRTKLALNWTEPARSLRLTPAPPDGSPLVNILLYLGLLTGMSGAGAHRRVSVERCKPCANPHNRDDMSKYLPDGLTQYVLNYFTN